MCGVAAIVGERASRQRVSAMADAVRHRGPDDVGIFDAAGIALAHRRLSIIDLSPAGKQPMVSHDGRYQLIFNGELFNYKELAAKLASTRVAWRSSSDTEVVLEAFARLGPRCLDDFVGMYALAIWDERERRLFVARDRLGIKPLYIAPLGKGWAIASEIGALLAAGVEASADDGVIFDFLARDFYEHGDDCFFRGIRKLPAAHWAWIEDGKPIEPRRYWSLADDVAKITVASDRIARGDELVARMSDAVRLALRSDVPIGITLSGGLDSAVLLSLVDRERPDKIAAFSFDFAEEQYSERPWVEEMARHSGHAATFRTVTPADFVESLDRIIGQQQEPHAGAPITAYTLCFELLRQSGVIVAMDGTGIDEGLAGYGRFRPALWADLAAAGARDELAAELAAASTTHAQALPAIQAAASMHGDIGRGQDLTTSVRPDCLGERLAKIDRPLPAFERPFPDALRNLMFRELVYTKLPRALRFRDRLSMAFGAELRPPFLDHRLLAYMFALPAGDRIHRGATKALLRDAAERILPDSVRLASKRSVQTPQREWFRGPLAAWLRDEIDRDAFWHHGWVDRTRALAALDQFLAGHGDNSFFVWQWLALSRWSHMFLESR